MKKLIAGAAILITLFSLWFYSRHPLQTTVSVRDATFLADVAVTGKEKELGLGNRKDLPKDHGMLFVYDHKEKYPFWMKNMHFPIDIIWIDDRTIVDITKNVPVSNNPIDSLPIYYPAVPVDKILEINAGLSDIYSISVGDRVKIKN